MVYSVRFLTHSTRLISSPHLGSKSFGGGYFTRIGASGRKAVIETDAPSAEFYVKKPEYPPITVSFGSTDTEAIKAEYVNFVQSLPTAKKKVFAVSPYERPWTRPEGWWHRDYMHPQPEPRPIFRVYAVPEHYNLLSFYQFITKTHCIDGLPPSFHEEVSVDKSVEEFTPLALELIHNEQQSWEQRRFSSTEYAYNVVDQLVNAANSLFSPDFPHVADAQVSRRSSIQAVWARGGFRSLYPDDDKKPVKFLDPEWGTEILGDDRSKLGELPFCLREKLSLSVRNRLPLPETCGRHLFHTSASVLDNQGKTEGKETHEERIIKFLSDYESRFVERRRGEDIVKYIANKEEAASRRLDSKFEKLGSQFEKLESKFEKLETKFDTKFEKSEAKSEEIRKKVWTLTGTLGALGFLGTALLFLFRFGEGILRTITNRAQ